MPEMTDAYGWQGRTVVASDGEKIGSISDIYEDPHTGRPEWATVNTGLFGTKSTFVPLAGASPHGEDVCAQVTKQQVQDAPRIDPDEELSAPEEARLFAHYGVPYGHKRGSMTDHAVTSEPAIDDAVTSEPATEDAVTSEPAIDDAVTSEPATDDAVRSEPAVDDAVRSEPATDHAVTRSEEELRIATRQRESGRVRLRKYVVTEHVTTTIPVRREAVRVEREPITAADAHGALSGSGLSEEEHEVILHEEVPVVEKRVVPKERVRLGKDAFAEEREISEQVRKEQIELDAADRVRDH